MAVFEVNLAIDEAHPALAGHFPGHPIVPAVVILNEVFSAAAIFEGAPLDIRSVTSAKFLTPLQPGQTFTILLKRIDNGRLSFVCKAPTTIIAAGEISYCLHS